MTHSLSRKFWITPDSGYRVASAGRAMKMSDGQGASRVIRPDRRGPGALGDRRENVAALERAWRAVDTTAAFIAGEAALRRKHAVGRIQGGALHTRLDAHVRAPATARDLECACVEIGRAHV